MDIPTPQEAEERAKLSEAKANQERVDRGVKELLRYLEEGKTHSFAIMEGSTLLDRSTVALKFYQKGWKVYMHDEVVYIDKYPAGHGKSSLRIGLKEFKP